MPTRNLLLPALLVALRGCAPQLMGHLQGNVSVGNDKATQLAVITQWLPYLGHPRTLDAIWCLNEGLPEAS